MEDKKKIEAWERQPDEGEKPFEAFCAYRDMGAKRTFTAVAEKLQKSDSLLRRWAKAYNWKARVNAYDNSLEKKAHKKAVKTAEEVRQEHITIANALQHKALTALNELDPSELTPRDIKEMLKLAFEVQQSLILDKAASDNPANMSLSDFIDAAYKRRMEGGDIDK